MDISLQLPRYVSPKTRYEAAKHFTRVEVAIHCNRPILFVALGNQYLCVAMYKRHPRMDNVPNYIFANSTSFANVAKRMASLAVQLQYLNFLCGVSCYSTPLEGYSQNTTTKLLAHCHSCHSGPFQILPHRHLPLFYILTVFSPIFLSRVSYYWQKLHAEVHIIVFCVVLVSL